MKKFDITVDPTELMLLRKGLALLELRLLNSKRKDRSCLVMEQVVVAKLRAKLPTAE